MSLALMRRSGMPESVPRRAPIAVLPPPFRHEPLRRIDPDATLVVVRRAPPARAMTGHAPFAMLIPTVNVFVAVFEPLVIDTWNVAFCTPATSAVLEFVNLVVTVC